MKEEIKLNFYVPKSLHIRLKLYCVAHDLSIRKYVSALIEKDLLEDREEECLTQKSK